MHTFTLQLRKVTNWTPAHRRGSCSQPSPSSHKHAYALIWPIRSKPRTELISTSGALACKGSTRSANHGHTSGGMAPRGDSEWRLHWMCLHDCVCMYICMYVTHIFSTLEICVCPRIAPFCWQPYTECPIHRMSQSLLIPIQKIQSIAFVKCLGQYKNILFHHLHIENDFMKLLTYIICHYIQIMTTLRSGSSSGHSIAIDSSPSDNLHIIYNILCTNVYMFQLFINLFTCLCPFIMVCILIDTVLMTYTASHCTCYCMASSVLTLSRRIWHCLTRLRNYSGMFLNRACPLQYLWEGTTQQTYKTDNEQDIHMW